MTADMLHKLEPRSSILENVTGFNMKSKAGDTSTPCERFVEDIRSRGKFAIRVISLCTSVFVDSPRLRLAPDVIHCWGSFVLQFANQRLH